MSRTNHSHVTTVNNSSCPPYSRSSYNWTVPRRCPNHVRQSTFLCSTLPNVHCFLKKICSEVITENPTITQLCSYTTLWLIVNQNSCFR